MREYILGKVVYSGKHWTLMGGVLISDIFVLHDMVWVCFEEIPELPLETMRRIDINHFCQLYYNITIQFKPVAGMQYKAIKEIYGKEMQY